MISAAKLITKEFEGIDLGAPYGQVIGQVPHNFSMAIWGSAGSGKSTLAVDLAYTLATKMGKGIYCSSEEGAGPSMQNKIKRLNASHPDLFIKDFDGLEDLKSAIKYSNATFCVFDSASMSHIKVSEMEDIHKYCKDNNVAFIYILHATKKGDFKGNSYLIHMCDIELQVESGIAKTNKNRFANTPQEFEINFEVEKREPRPNLEFKPEKKPETTPDFAPDRFNPAEMYGIEYIENPTKLDGYRENRAVTPDEIYQMITDKMIEKIKKASGSGYIKKWKENAYGSGFLIPINYVSKKEYRGINHLLLSGLTLNEALKNPYFLTFNQVKELKGKVKKGSVGREVIYFTILYLLEYQEGTTVKEFGTYSLNKMISFIEGNRDKVAKSLKESITSNPNAPAASIAEQTKIPILKYYKVFNGEDVEGIDFDLDNENIPGRLSGKPLPPRTPMPAAQGIIKHYPKPQPTIKHGGDRAFYTVNTNRVTVPYEADFETAQDYYRTLFHELTHCSGDFRHLGRPMSGKFGSKEYAKEELIAEFGAVYLSAEAGFMWITNKNHAEYIKSWHNVLGIIKEDNRFIMRAASQAQRAADYILDKDEAGVAAYLKEMSNTAPEKKSKDKDIAKELKFKNGDEVFLTIRWGEVLKGTKGIIRQRKQKYGVSGKEPLYRVVFGKNKGGQTLSNYIPESVLELVNEPDLAPSAKTTKKQPRKNPVEWIYLGIVEKLEVASKYTAGLQGSAGNKLFMFSDKTQSTLYIVPAKEVNQTASIADTTAALQFEEWHNYRADHKDMVINYPASAKKTKIGTATRIYYISDKIMSAGDKKGKDNRYVHDFDPGKRTTYIQGNIMIIENIKWNERGILN